MSYSISDLAYALRAGPNQRGGLVTRWSNDLVFNADTPGTVYSVAATVGKPSALPGDYISPGPAATWVWSGSGPPPWPGVNPADDPRGPLGLPDSNPFNTNKVVSDDKSSSVCIGLIIGTIAVFGTALLIFRKLKN